MCVCYGCLCVCVVKDGGREGGVSLVVVGKGGVRSDMACQELKLLKAPSMKC